MRPSTAPVSSEAEISFFSRRFLASWMVSSYSGVVVIICCSPSILLPWEPQSCRLLIPGHWPWHLPGQDVLKFHLCEMHCRGQRHGLLEQYLLCPHCLSFRHRQE